MRILGKNEILAAAELLRRDELVAIPTETVYGLGANALSKTAVQKIFAVKGRPMDNPLIIHIPDASALDLYCLNVPREAYELANAFWPGPVTMVLKRKACIPDFVTAGLDTVAVRCPACAPTTELLRMVDFPIAAPSANLSGRPSTTRVAHVIEDLDGKIEAVMDGGDCEIGVESTIIDLSGSRPVLLRPGGLPVEELEHILGKMEVDPAITHPLSKDVRPKAPGMKYRHYAPKAQVVVVTGTPQRSAAWIADHCTTDTGILCFEEYHDMLSLKGLTLTFGNTDRIDEQAHELFDKLRLFDHHPEINVIYIQATSAKGLGSAVMNRIGKASGFRFVDP